VVVLLLYVIARKTGVDFDANVWRPALDVRADRSPYPPPEPAALVKPFFLYPPLLLGLDLPLSVLPHDVARVGFAVLTAVAVVTGLRLAGVTDRRVLCWGTLSFPVVDALLLGNPTPLLVPVIAAAWVYRDRWWVVGLAVGVAGAFKLLVWPLGVWLIATRRIRGAAAAGVVAVGALLVPWALIGFDGFGDYVDVARAYERINGGPRAITVAGLVHELGGSWPLGHALQRGVGLMLLVAMVLISRSRASDADRKCFCLALTAALVLSPVVWIHYLVLVLVPLALTRPTFDRAWVAMSALWLFPLLPHREALTVVAGDHQLTAAGPVPTVAQLGVGHGCLSYFTWVARCDQNRSRSVSSASAGQEHR
jgi:hypothetical protein